MIDIILKREAIVRFPAGTVLNVSDEEARRQVALGNAEIAPKKRAPAKRPAKKE